MPKKVILFIFVSILIGLNPSFADEISCTEFFTQIEIYAEIQSAKDFQNQYGEEHFYYGKKTVQNYYIKFNNPSLAEDKSKPLIIFTGLEDMTENWFSTVEASFEKGYGPVYVVEIRGQGKSERDPLNQNQSVYVESHTDYSDDVVLFFSHLMKEKTVFARRPAILAHSTGALSVANAYSQIRWGGFLEIYRPTKMVFWTPLVKVKLTGNRWIDAVLNRVSPLHFFLDLYDLFKTGSVFRRGSFLADDWSQPVSFEENRLTSDFKRYGLYEYFYYLKKRAAKGVSFRWIVEALRGAKKFRVKSKKDIDIPTLIYRSKIDQVVDNRWKLSGAKNIRVIDLDLPMHALHLERWELVSQIARDTLDFLLEE